MTANRLPDYLDHMLEAASLARSYVRNRIAHGYFKIDLETVWETVQKALPLLIAQLPAVRARVP